MTSPHSDTSTSAVTAVSTVAPESRPTGSRAPAIFLASLAERLDQRFDTLACRLSLLTVLEERIAAAEARISVLENDNRVLSADNAALRLTQQAQHADMNALNVKAAQVAELDERCRTLSSDLVVLKQAQLDRRATQLAPALSRDCAEPIISGAPCSSPESIPLTVKQVVASLGSSLVEGDVMESRFLVT